MAYEDVALLQTEPIPAVHRAKHQQPSAEYILTKIDRDFHAEMEPKKQAKAAESKTLSANNVGLTPL